jgi:hypothetical protein
MNLRHGFKRITVVLSLLVALIAAVLGFVSILDTWNYECNTYNEYKNDYENITNFWLIWDANGWIGGKYETVRHLLNLRQSGNEQYQYGSTEFDFGDKVVTLYTHNVFPGINKNMLYMPLDALDIDAQAAKEEAVKNAEKRMEQYEWWGERKTDEVILLCILVALVCAIIGYLGTWVVLWFGGMALYKFGSKFIRWLVQGFRDDMREQVEKVEPTSEMMKIKQILKRIFMPQAAEEDERFGKIAKQIAERHNKYGVTLTDPRTGEDLLAGMTDEQREKYRQFKIKTSNIKQK